MSIDAGEIIGALEALEVARFKLNPVNEVLGLSGLGADLQPTIVVGATDPSDSDGRPDGTVYVTPDGFQVKKSGGYEEVGSPGGTENGFENRTTSTIAFVEATRTFTITSVGTCYYWSNGVRYTLPASESIVIPDIQGIHSIYYNGTTLTVVQAFTEDIITDFTFVAAIYWDTVDDIAIIFGDERHGRIMDSITHLYLHATRGARWASGLRPVEVTSSGSGAAAIDAQIGIEAGVIWDEDIKFEWPADPRTLAAPILYRNGAVGDWRKIASTGYIVTTTGTGRAAYNQNTGGTVWQLTEVTTADFVLSHLVATNDSRNPLVWIVGQADYTTLANARAGCDVEYAQLSTGGLASLFAEFVILASFIVQTANGYGNAVKSRVQPLADGSQFLDLRRK